MRGRTLVGVVCLLAAVPALAAAPATESPWRIEGATSSPVNPLAVF